MPRKSVYDFRFHEVLQTTIIRQITKGNEEIEKIKNNSGKNRRNLYKSLYVHVSVFMCACVCVGGL